MNLHLAPEEAGDNFGSSPKTNLLRMGCPHLMLKARKSLRRGWGEVSRTREENRVGALLPQPGKGGSHEATKGTMTPMESDSRRGD